MKKVYLLIFLTTAIFFLGASFYVFRSKEKANEKEKIELKMENNSETKKNASSEYSPTEVNPSDEVQKEVENWDNFSAPTISPKDCDGNCQKFTNQREKFYCQKVCGFPLDDPEENIDYPEDSEDDESSDTDENVSDNPTDCEKLVKIDRDVCLKDKAVRDRDFNICDQVSDFQIRKTCKARITEDIFNSQ